jgi:hypothetical protein
LYPGGTDAWGKFLAPYFTPFDPTVTYEDGTLLFRPYKDLEDQGHIALIIGEKIYHSYFYVWEPRGTNLTRDPGVSHTPIESNYYTFTAPPSAWL